LYLDGRVECEDSQTQAIKCFKRGAELGDAQSHFSLALCYTHGKGVEKDEYIAFTHLQHAAKADLPIAMHNLACAYFAGKGVNLDFLVAAEWFQKAAKLGFAPAQVNLGNMHYHGLGVEKDMKKAKELYLQASVTDQNALALYEKVVSEEIQNET
jgi:TPR repeat protein